MQTRTTIAPALDEVIRWRTDRLVESGFARSLATSVAENSRYDLHALIELAERGCRPDLAVRILAPIEDGSA
jgi:hypothetical protein